MTLSVNPPPKKPGLPDEDRAAAMAELGEMRRQMAAARAMEESDKDRGARAPALADAVFAPAQPAAQKASRYTVVFRTPVPSGNGPVPAMRADKLTWDKAGVWLRVDGGKGRIFVPFEAIGCIQDDE